MDSEYFHTDISKHIWETKYRFHDGDVIHDQTIEDTWWRIANSLADAENNERKYWAQKFFDELKGFRFIPGGRIQAGAGTGHQVTLFNCFVMGRFRIPWKVFSITSRKVHLPCNKAVELVMIFLPYVHTAH